VVDAQRAARALGHEAIGTEHVLLGLLARDDDLAARLLAGWGVERADVERDVVARHAEAPSGGSEGPRRRVGRGGRSARDGDDAAGDRPHRRSRHHIPFTRPAKKTLELALRESMALGNAYIGAEHVLLGLLRADDIAAELLAARGVTYDRVHAALGETVGDGPTGD
jgi:ATP-dependent Clp protease ATP-binding subunit ClpA